MSNFVSDLGFGLRVLRKSPGFTLTIITVLALGIGANAAVFSVIDAVLLRGLPLRDPEQVVMLWEKNPTLGPPIGDRVPVACTTFLEWVRQATQFEAIGGFEDANFNLTSGAEPERIEGARASLVNQRTQEIGIRMALGAQTKDVLGLVIGEGFWMVALGLIIGVASGFGLSRALASLFFGVSPANPVTYLEVALVMIVIALIACLLPAWRAIRVNPMVALRHD